MTSETFIGDVRAATSCNCAAKYQWEIKNFWICCLQAGDMVVSPKFLATHDSNPFMWIQLMFYPKGKTEEFIDYFSLFVKILTRSADADIKELSLSILNDGFELITQVFHQPTQADTSIWGAEKFVARSIIKEKANKNGRGSDNLAIVLKINTQKSEQKMNVLQVRQNVGHLQRDFGKLVNTEDYSDIELVIGDKSLLAHGMIISRMCPILAVSLMKNMRETHGGNKVEIKNMRYEVCLEMLRYLYTEKVNNIDDIANELLAAAHEYGIHGLKLICEKSLIRNVNIDNVLEKLKLAHSCDAELLKVTTVGFISAHYDAISRKPEFKALAPAIGYLIFTAIFNRLR